MASAFYIIYLVRQFQVSESSHLMTAVLAGSQIAANPILGWLGDRWESPDPHLWGSGCDDCALVATLRARCHLVLSRVHSHGDQQCRSVDHCDEHDLCSFGVNKNCPRRSSNTLIAPGAILALIRRLAG
jgi:hypothetical protein